MVTLRADPTHDEGRPGERAALNVNNGDTSTVQESSAPPWITGSVYVDLTDARADKARMRVYRALIDAPPGAHVVVYVGPLAVNPAVIPVVWEHGQHVRIEISGHGYAVARWVEALRDGLGVVS